MTQFESLIALLHVTALVGALSAAYAGIDRRHVETEKAEFHKQAKRLAIEILQSLGVMDLSMQDVMKSNRWRRIRIILPVYVICVVADKKLPATYVQSVLRWFYRQKCIPLYLFYRAQRDRVVAGVMSFVSFSLFFLISGALVWRNSVIMNDTFMHIVFLLMITFAALLVGLGMTSRQLNEQRTIQECQRLSSLVNKRLEKLLTFAQGIICEYTVTEDATVQRAASRR